MLPSLQLMVASYLRYEVHMNRQRSVLASSVFVLAACTRFSCISSLYLWKVLSESFSYMIIIIMTVRARMMMKINVFAMVVSKLDVLDFVSIHFTDS